MRSMTYCGMMMLAIAQSGQAKEPASAADLKRLEAKVPSQSWYPAGYYDVRIAAEGQVAEFPRPRDWWLMSLHSEVKQEYNVHQCGDEFVLPEHGDEASARYGDGALLVARIRYELDTLGYPLATYREPLLAYERLLIAEADARPLAEVMLIIDDDPIEGEDAAGTTDDPMELADATITDNPTEGEDAAGIVDEALTDPAETAGMPEYSEEPGLTLANAIEANRQKHKPSLPEVMYESCGGDARPAPVIVRTIPPGGTVMLASAFAFKVCTRKQPNPWDRFACRWNEVETGKPTRLRGRNVYQVRWPDGTERRGTREFELNYDDDEPITATFRKTGG